MKFLAIAFSINYLHSKKALFSCIKAFIKYMPNISRDYLTDCKSFFSIEFILAHPYLMECGVEVGPATDLTVLENRSHTYLDAGPIPIAHRYYGVEKIPSFITYSNEIARMNGIDGYSTGKGLYNLFSYDSNTKTIHGATDTRYLDLIVFIATRNEGKGRIILDVEHEIREWDTTIGRMKICDLLEVVEVSNISQYRNNATWISVFTNYNPVPMLDDFHGLYNPRLDKPCRIKVAYSCELVGGNFGAYSFYVEKDGIEFHLPPRDKTTIHLVYEGEEEGEEDLSEGEEEGEAETSGESDFSASLEA